VNLLTDGAPALALGVDPVDRGVLERAPRSRSERQLAPLHVSRLGVRGLVLALPALAGLSVSHLWWEEPWSEARSLAFTLLVTTHLLYSLALGQARRNRWLVVAVLASLGLQASVVSWGPAQDLFRTTALTGGGWALALTLPVAAVAAVRLLMHLERSTSTT
jgi:Ca2+-transporting ATPase